MVPDAPTTVATIPVAAERLRGARDDRRVLQAPRWRGSRQEPRGRGRRRQHRPAGGREGRQLRARQRVARRRRLRRHQPEEVRRTPADSQEGVPRSDRKDDERTERRRRTRDRRRGLGSERTAGGAPGDHDPDGLHADPAPFDQREHQRRRLRRAQPARRRLRRRTVHEAAPASVDDRSGGLSLRAHNPRRRRSRAAATATRTANRSSWYAKHPTVLPFALETTSAQTLEDDDERRHA